MVRRGKAISGVHGKGDRLWVGCDDDVGVGNREGAAGVDAADALWDIQNQCNPPMFNRSHSNLRK
jgi:hypothetical protein